MKNDWLYITWMDDREAEIRNNYDIYATILDYNNVSPISLKDKVSTFKFELKQNYPNPFNSETVILYELFTKSEVELSVFNTLGQTISTLIDRTQDAGRYRIIWDAKNNVGESISSGVYFVRIIAGGPVSSSGQSFVDVKKMVLMK
jgi:flagellar hook assembly protein FlgD